MELRAFMAQLDPTIVLSQFLGSLPTFIAVILAWMHNNARIGDVNRRIDDANTRFDKRFDDLKDVIRSEMRRMEEVMDARLKHLEEG